MKVVNTHEAKTNLSQLLERVAKGEEIVIAKAGKPVARLTAWFPDTRPRKGGQWKGLVKIGRDFDAPLPDDVAAAFREPSR
ncbi:MAG: type II toxin-antitoxin system Phd/YefM family antitoxin [Planctomycetota bacterium]